MEKIRQVEDKWMAEAAIVGSENQNHQEKKLSSDEMMADIESQKKALVAERLKERELEKAKKEQLDKQRNEVMADIESQKKALEKVRKEIGAMSNQTSTTIH